MPIKLKRSSVAGKAPVVGDLELGELALNTHDGKLYTKKNNGTESIVEIGGGAVTSVAGKTGAVTLAKADVGLGNVDNTSDANKPISTATQTALNAKVDTSRTLSASGLATGGGDLSANRTIDVAAATAAEYRVGTATKAVSVQNAWSAMAEVALTDAGTIAWDLSTGIDFTVTLAGNRVLGNPTNVTVGKKGRLRVVQDGAGSKTLSYSANYEFAGGTAPVLSTAANAQDVLYYDVIATTRMLLSILKDVK